MNCDLRIGVFVSEKFNKLLQIIKSTILHLTLKKKRLYHEIRELATDEEKINNVIIM